MSLNPAYLVTQRRSSLSISCGPSTKPRRQGGVARPTNPSLSGVLLFFFSYHLPLPIDRCGQRATWWNRTNGSKLYYGPVWLGPLNHFRNGLCPQQRTSATMPGHRADMSKNRMQDESGDRWMITTWGVELGYMYKVPSSTGSDRCCSKTS